MNNCVIVNYETKTYYVLKTEDLLKKFKDAVFYKLKDLIHGVFEVYDYSFDVCIYKMASNSKFRAFKKELNLYGYTYKYFN